MLPVSKPVSLGRVAVNSLNASQCVKMHHLVPLLWQFVSAQHTCTVYITCIRSTCSCHLFSAVAIIHNGIIELCAIC